MRENWITALSTFFFCVELALLRLRNYHRLLEQEDVTLVRCDTVNPAELLPTQDDGELHDCVQEAEVLKTSVRSAGLPCA